MVPVTQWYGRAVVQCPLWSRWPSAHSGPVPPVPLYPLWSSGPCVPVPTVAQYPQWSSGYSVPVPPVPPYPQYPSGPRGTVSLPGSGHQGSGGSGSAQPSPTGVCQVRESGRGQDCSAVVSSPPLLGLRRVRQKLNKNR